ncbi:cytotoxin [Drechslerella dactyloides]|uniref:Cytotoxin n=1 Tax=Drechslerella dactyloides TaxID=74499 RepID=A0AAD6NL28_DREDA|nr:cytotoxin [Drechslerella dactyloides]
MADASGPADPAIHDFVENPETFLIPSSGKATAVGSESILRYRPADLLPGVVPKEGYFKFVRPDPARRTFEIRYHGAQKGADTVFAYHLGYNGGGQRSARPAFIDIPKNAPEGTLLFTGSLSGCSVIVTDHDKANYRVFHDSRLESSLFYDKVEMAIDYSGYSRYSDAMACVFMQYRKGQWNMFVQGQTLERSADGSVVVVPREMPFEGFFLRVFKPRSYNAAVARKMFLESREEVINSLVSLFAVAFPGEHRQVPKVKDGEFEPFENYEIKIDNPAVNRAQAIRDGLRNVPIATSMSRESEKLDLTYLWIKQKELKGLDTVVRQDAQLQTQLGNTAGERLVGEQLDALLARDEEFAAGYRSDSVDIPGYKADMTALEMTKLFESSSKKLTRSQMGMLVRRISIVREQEVRTSVWDLTNQVVEMFQNKGGSTKPMPQDILLNAVPDEYGGRCYPLVRAMSVALAATQPDSAIDQLAIKLTALSPDKQSNDIKNAEVFKRCLKDLHASYPAAEASTLIGPTTLKDAVAKLQVGEGESIVFALNTNIHAMLLGATNRNGKTSYHFYDPNFALATFASREELLNATTTFFTELGLAEVYGAEGNRFTLVVIDTDKMAHIEFDFDLNVADFMEPDTLLEIAAAKNKAAVESHPLDPTRPENRALKAGTSLLEASVRAEAWREATAKLEASTGLGGHWTPILTTLEKEGTDPKGKAYRIQFINLENPTETRWISTEDPAIKDFKTYLDKRLRELKKAYDFEAGTALHGDGFQREGIESAEAIDGLNAMFVVRTLIEHFMSKKDDSEGNAHINSNLATALEVHSWLNLTQLGQQSLNDVGKLVELTRTLIRTEQAAESSLSTIAKTFGRTSEGLGLVLGVANVVLDAYELSQADNETQRAVFSTQLAFDSASLLTGGGGAAAGILGASGAAVGLGGLGVILGGLAIGFGGLAAAFGEVAQNAQAVGKYFGDVDGAYRAGGYKYDKEHKILIPLAGAVISELDVTGNVKFGTQYIYRVHHGSTGSGKGNYFFWAGDFPVMVNDKSQAIDVRDGIKCPATGTLADTGEYTAIILPATPISYISYLWTTLPFATGRHDYGFDVIRRLEDDYRFDFDFYIFPSEWIVNKISHKYVETPVTVNLGERPIRVQVPKLPNELRGVLKYSLYGAGADYTIGLNAGVGMTLSSKSDSTRWILDCRDLEGDPNPVIKDDSVSVAGLQVTFKDRKFSSTLVINSSAEVLQVDFKKHTASLIEVDASKFPGGNQKLSEHLNDLSDKHMLEGTSITVENYTTPSGEKVGRAFYEIAEKRFVYTSGLPEELTTNAKLGVDMGADGVYFYNTEHAAIWRVNPENGALLAKYQALYPSSKRTLLGVWKEDDRVHAVFRHQLSKDKSAELGYIVTADSIKLISAAGTTAMLSKLSKQDKLEDSIDQLLKDYHDLDGPTSAAPSSAAKKLSANATTNVEATTDSPMLFVFGQGDGSRLWRFWIRAADGVIISPNFTPPADLILAGIIPLVGNAEEYCFYSHKDQKLTIQQGTGRLVGKAEPVTIPPEFGKLLNVFGVSNQPFVITTSGYILRLGRQGALGLEAVNKEWFTQFKSGNLEPWWKVLKDIAGSHDTKTVAILGLHDAKDAVVPAWFCNGRIVVASSSLRGQQFQLAGLTDNGKKAWLCHQEKEDSGQLYSQPLIPFDKLATVLSPKAPEVISDKVQQAQKIPALEPYPFKEVSLTNNRLRYVTTEGVILILLDEKTISLYGVDEAWQKAHKDKLEAGLAELAGKWKNGEAIALAGSEPKWYLVPAGKVISMGNDSITWRDSPVWLGADVNGKKGYVYLAVRGKIYSLGINEPVQTQGVTMAARLNDLLVLVHPREASLTPFTVQDVRYIVEGSDVGQVMVSEAR